MTINTDTGHNQSQVVLPGTIKIVSQRVDYAVRIYEIEETEPHTDAALLSYVGCNSWLGGRVMRQTGRTLVYRHTS
jgi:hypothetical protein